jgi:aminobenzoyl-glutamate utilization protein B
MAELGPPIWDSEDYKFAEEMYKTHPKDAFDTLMHMAPTDMKEELKQHKDKVLCDFIIPNYGNKMVEPGSTDVSDVSWKVPLSQFSTACTVMGAPGHSWQAASCGRMGIGHKGMILAAKILATTAMDFFSNPELVQRAKDEFNQEEETYKSPFPDDHKPPFHRLTEDKLQKIE